MEFKYKAKKNLNEIIEGKIEGGGIEQVLEELQAPKSPPEKMVEV